MHKAVEAARPRCLRTALPEPKFFTAQGRGDRAVLSGEVTDDEGTLGPGQHVGPQLEVTDAGSIELVLAGGRGPDAVDLVGGMATTALRAAAGSVFACGATWRSNASAPS
ncbi:hypothetical protein ABT390_04885 [Streptomyces aurantiacus]|uniref:hypothetical protein n=1 Tax=Streptomyces aurantiacus TaxID=47760 RepID=UPI001319D312|nr:hypothetical protein [Streptomyces aurantiacus]